MCISDYRIGRLIRHVPTTYNTTGPIKTTFGPDASRIGILVTPNAVAIGVTAAIVLTFDTGAVLTKIGGSTPMAAFLLKDFGDIVQRGFVITALTTQHTGVLTELILPPDLLPAELDKFRGY